MKLIWRVFYGVRETEQSPVSVTAFSSAGGFNEASRPTVDLVLLVTPEQFKDQAILTIGCYSLHWKTAKTQAQHQRRMFMKTPAKILPSTPLKHALYVKMYKIHFCCK